MYPLNLIFALIFGSSMMLPAPDVIEPSEESLFPDYGFKQSDSEKFLPILNLVNSGAYKVQIFETRYLDGKPQNEYKSHDDFSLASYFDSISIEKYNVGKDTKLESREVYTKKGKLIFAYDEKGQSKTIYDPQTHTDFHYIKNILSPLTNDKSSLYLYSISEYDEHNRLLKSIDFDPFGKISHKSIIQRDRWGATIQIDRFDRINNVRLPRDADSIAMRKWLDSAMKVKEEFKINEKYFVQTDSAAHTITTSGYHYDSNNDSILKTIVIESYDSQWRNTGTDNIFPGGKLQLSFRTQYDGNGNIIKESTISNGNTIMTNSLYDKSNRIISSETSTGNKVTFHENWEYNNIGKPKSQTKYYIENPIHSEEKMEWNYDTKGNIIEVIRSLDGEVAEKYRFKIYYK